MGDREQKYDTRKRARADNIAAIRALVAGYLAYLAWQIVKGVRSGESTMTPAVGYAIAALFVLAAAAFTVYLIRQWRLETEAARLPESDETKENTEDEM